MKYYPLLPTRKVTKTVCTYIYSRKKVNKPATVHECLINSQESSTKIYSGCLLIVLIFIVVNFYYYPVDKLDFQVVLSHITFNNAVVNDDSKESVAKSFVLSPFYAVRNRSLEKAEEADLDLIRKKHKNLAVCQMNMTGLGPIGPTKTNAPVKYIDATLFPAVHKGGFYTPPLCQARHKIIILVTFRNRYNNLGIFLIHMHRFLIKQKLEYRVFVIEQADTYPFNKGRLYNAGFLESQRFGMYQCIIFHDIDLLPLDERILYTCPIGPRHMSATVIQRRHSNRYHSMFGGVTAMTPEHFRRANGYSNWYWGWGGEDHDMFWRLRASGLQVIRYKKSIALYFAIPHNSTDDTQPNALRYELLRTAKKRRQDEGLSSVDYRVLNTSRYHLYTHIKVNINPYNEDPKNVKLYLNSYL